MKIGEHSEYVTLDMRGINTCRVDMYLIQALLNVIVEIAPPWRGCKVKCQNSFSPLLKWQNSEILVAAIGIHKVYFAAMWICAKFYLYKELKFASHEIETSVGSMCTMWVWWYNNFLPGFSSKLVSSMAYWQKNCCAKSFTKRYLIGYPLKSTYCFWDTIHSLTISYIYLPNLLVYI